MHPRHKKFAAPALIAVAAIGVLAGGAIAFVRTGVYNVGADDPHYPATHAVLRQLREASIARRARAITPPADLDSPARIAQGAGNYDAMCTGCHLAPGMAPTELSRGLYPAPPVLARADIDAARAFWTIKHGIKASGMPAWGGSMADGYIWNLVAFLKQLPRLDPAGYRALVARSGGHSHGGGETGEGAPHHHDGAMPAMAGMDHPAADARGHAGGGHTHPPGTPPHDDAPAASKPTPAHVDAPGAHEHGHAHGGAP